MTYSGQHLALQPINLCWSPWMRSNFFRLQRIQSGSTAVHDVKQYRTVNSIYGVHPADTIRACSLHARDMRRSLQ